MQKSLEEKNKAVVLEAFDTLFNRRDYETLRGSSRPTTFSTALTSSQAARGCSIWSNDFHRLSSMNQARSLPTESLHSSARHLRNVTGRIEN